MAQRDVPRQMVVDLRRAQGLEAGDPAHARILYRRVDRWNQDLDHGILLLGLTSVLLASALVLREPLTLTAAAIFAGLGVAPPVLLRLQKNGALSRARPGRIALDVMRLAGDLLSSPSFLSYRIMLRIALMLAPVLFAFLALSLWLGDDELNPSAPQAWPLASWLSAAALASVFAVAVVMELAQVWWRDLMPPRIGLRVLTAGLWVNRLEIVSLAALLLTTTVLVGGFSNALVGGFSGGLFLGLGLARRTWSPELAEIVALGLLRCDLRLGFWGFAGYRLREIWRDEMGSAQSKMSEFEQSGWELIDGDESRPRLHLMRALAPVVEDLRHGTAKEAPPAGHRALETALLRALVPAAAELPRGKFTLSPAVEGHLRQARKRAIAMPAGLARVWSASIDATLGLAQGYGAFKPSPAVAAPRLEWKKVAAVGRGVYAGMVSTGAGALLGVWLGRQLGDGFPALAGLTLGMLFGLGLTPIGWRLVEMHHDMRGMQGG